MAVTKYSALERFSGLRNQNTEQTLSDSFKRKKEQEEQKKAKVQSAYQKATAPGVDFSALTRGLATTAKKEYTDYVQSAGAKTKSQDALDRAIQMVLSGGGSVADAPLETFRTTDAKEQELRAKADYYGQQVQAQADEKIMEADLAELESWPEKDKAALENYIIQRNQQAYRGTTDTFDNADYTARELMRKYGAQRVKELAESYQRNQNAQNAEKAAQAAREGAGSGFWKAAGHSAASVGANLLGNITSPLGYVGEVGQRTGRYQTFDPNNVGNLPNVYSGAVREQVAKDIEGDGGALRKAGAYLYQGGMSMADSMARLGLGGGAAGAARLAAAGSLGQGISQYSSQGASPMEALTMASAGAGLEYLTEKIPMDELLKAGKGGVKTLGQAAKAAGKQALSETLTEEASLLGTKAAENVLLGEKSARNQRIAQLVAEGASIADAQKQVNKELLQEALDTGIVSAISGGMSSAGQSAGLKVAEKVPKLTWDNVGQWVVDAAMGRKPGADTQAQAEKNTAQQDGESKQVNVGRSPTYNELMAKRDVPVVTLSANTEGKTYAQLKTDVLNKATEQKWFDEPHMNDDTGMPVFLTDKSFSHAFSNLSAEFGEDTILAMEQIPELIRNAVLTNVSDPKNPNKSENRVFTLFAAVRGANGVEPVKLTVKEYVHGKGLNLPRNILNYFNKNKMEDKHNRLYDAKALEVVAIESAEKESGASVSAAEALTGTEAKDTPNSTIRVADLLDLVKGDAEKYIPKSIKKEADVLGKTIDRGPSPSLISASEDTVAENGAVVNGDSAPEGMDHGAVGAAEGNFTGTAAYDNLLRDDNVQSARATDAKYEEVPKVDGYGRKVSEFAHNVINSEVISERDVTTVKQLIQDGAFGHDTQKMADVRAAAVEKIAQKGAASSAHAITRAVANGKFDEHTIAEAQVLFAHYTNQNGKAAQEIAGELLVDLSQMATSAGRQLNMVKLLRQLTPEGQLMAVKKNVDRYVSNLNTGRSRKKQANVAIPQELEQAFMEAATQEEREEAAQAIYKNIAGQIPATLGEKWDAWRHLAMLGNLKTQERNFLGSGAFLPYTAIKRTIGAGIERLTLKQENRTKAVLGVGKEAKALKDWAKADAGSKAAQDAMQYSGSTGDKARTEIDENRRIFNNSLLEGARKGNRNLMEKGDMVWKKREYALTLAAFLKARGYTAQQVQDGQVPDNVLREGRELAVKEAMKATFNDRNKFSDAIARFRVKGNSGWSRVLNAATEGIMPYTRTPANVLVRAKEYSPVELAKGFADLATKVKTGEKTVAEGIDEIASGLTGTGMMLLGAALANGLIPGVRLVGKVEDEDELAEGVQEYALEIGGTSYGIEWLAPANIPLFIGVNFNNAIRNARLDGDLDAWELASALVEAGSSVMDPLLELSCMSSLNDLVENVSYEDSAGDKLIAGLTSIATSYFMQGLPTIFGHIEQATEGNKKSVYSDADNEIQRSVEKTIGRATQKLPGDLYQVDRIDENGNTKTGGDNLLERIFNGLINPFSVSKIQRTAVSEEIKRLESVQEDNVTAPKVQQTISYTDSDGKYHKDKWLTEEEYETLQRVQRQTAQNILDKMVQSDDYQTLTDQQKAKAFGYVYDYAREKARTEAIADYEGMDSWMEGIDGKEAGTILNKVAAAQFTDAMSALTESWREGYDPSGAVEALEGAYEVYQGMSAEARNKLKADASGRMKDFLTAKGMNMKTETFIDLYRQYYDLDQSSKSNTEKAQEWAYKLERAVETGRITEKQKNALKDQMVFMQMFPAETEKFDQLVETGISADKAQNLGWAIKGLKPQQGYSSVRDVQKAEAIGKASLSEADKIAALKVYGTDAQDENLDQMLDMGFDAAEYVAAYQMYANASGQGKKARTIEAYQKQFGVDYETAKAIYEIYG